MILNLTLSQIVEKLGQGGSEDTVSRRFLMLETRDLCSKLDVMHEIVAGWP